LLKFDNKKPILKNISYSNKLIFVYFLFVDFDDDDNVEQGDDNDDKRVIVVGDELFE
jgi:hypothetical protein